MIYAELRQEMAGKYISYSLLLTTHEWQERRLEIIRRDQHCCTNCGKEETCTEYDAGSGVTWYFWLVEIYGHWVKNRKGQRFFLELDEPDLTFEIADKPYYMQVHHKRYIQNRLPWEYSDEELITLCHWCHLAFHQKHEVDVYAEDGLTLLKDISYCKRCHGVGSFPEYMHVQGGICFECGGERYDKPLVRIMG